MDSGCTFEYNALIGIVSSRRLGISLGVDLVPHKTCGQDCDYCECDKTTRLKDASGFLENAENVNDESCQPETAMGHTGLMERLAATVWRRPYTATDGSWIVGFDVERVQQIRDRWVASNQLANKLMARGGYYVVS